MGDEEGAGFGEEDSGWEGHIHTTTPAHPLLHTQGMGAVRVLFYLQVGVQMLVHCYFSLNLSKRFDAAAQENPGLVSTGLEQSYLTPLLGGRLLDVSDRQWTGFRNFLPLMTVWNVIFLLLSGAVRSPVVVSIAKMGSRSTPNTSLRVVLYCIMGLGHLAVLHGTYAVLLVAIALVNYALACLSKWTYLPHALWVFNVAVLLCLRIWHVFGTSWSSMFGVCDTTRALEGYSGLYSWWLPINFLILRQISYGMDRWWQARGMAVERPLRKERSDLDLRVTSSRSAAEYRSVLLYLAYLFYPPLYFAGPIASFNCFASCIEQPSKQDKATLLRYALRILLSLLLLDVFLSLFHVNAISNNLLTFVTDGERQQKRLIDVVMRDYAAAVYFPYWQLNHIWLKFLIIWRFARAVALFDGIDCYENMGICISSQASVSGFWRNWHLSFNRWLVRYLYVPLGGRGGTKGSTKRYAANIFVTFSFVAVWHDWTPQLLVWGLGLVAFMLAETLAHRWAQSLSVQELGCTTPQWVRMLRGAGLGASFFGLIVLNSIGYGTGWDGFKALVPHMFSTWQATAVSLYFAGSWMVIRYLEAEVKQDQELGTRDAPPPRPEATPNMSLQV